MDEKQNDKDQLNKIIADLGESLDPDTAKKINFQQLDRVRLRLHQFFDECEECQKHTHVIIDHIEATNKFSDLNKQELKSFHNDMKSVVSHMQKRHNLISDGYYVSIYLGLGLIIGIAIGTSLKNLALGMSIGMLIGVAVGVALDADYRKKGRVL